MARALLGAATLAAVLAHGVAAAQPYVFPRYGSAAEVEADCQRLLADQKAAERRLEQGSADGGVAVLVALDAMTIRYEDTLGPLALLASVHPDKAIRDAADACELGHQEFHSAFLQNATVHALLRQVQPADDIDRRYLRDTLDAFEDSGVGLSVEKQARVRAINTEITRLAQEFERRIREDRTRVPYTAAELKGVPAGVRRREQRDAQGRYLLGLDAPTVGPVLERAVSATTREHMWRAAYAQGGRENLKVLARLAELRREAARLFGFDSYDDFVLRRRMAKSEAAVAGFLAEVQAAVAERELRDLAMLRAEKAKRQKTPIERTMIERWDVSYYRERVRAGKYNVDQEPFRRHFPPEASLQFVYALAERLFGVRFVPQPQTLWHRDARAYGVSDVATGRELGTLFVDLYPRADKYNHAAVWSFRNGSTRAARRPAAGLVANFDRKGLSIEELETLLHEFGHALHALLSTTRYAAQGGTNVQHDFAEAPSQMLEDWVYDPKVLALFQQFCKACPPVPPALIARAERARQFAKGIEFARQQLYASYDLAVYGRRSEDPMALWARMESATPIGHVPGSMFPASFAHIATNYAAGYYGYLWSLAVAEDLRTAFAADKLDPSVGRRYRDTVLARGGEVAPEDLLRQFLGRPTDRQAFFKSLAKE
jgi:thimet oligopeptidase